MAIGPGKYDDICTRLRTELGITDDTGGGVILIVCGGAKGNGMSCQADIETTLALPGILENTARLIREHGIA